MLLFGKPETGGLRAAEQKAEGKGEVLGATAELGRMLCTNK